MSPTRAWTDGRGAVALAAFRPDPALFDAQLKSIRDQTRSDFVCLVGVDGGVAEVERLVREAVGNDRRFRVLGWEERLGFYANFERILSAVPSDCTWVALSDQDDEWLPDKLELLVPLLAEHPLATGQARVVSARPAGVILERTDRRVVAPQALLMHNQVTGSLSVFRRDLLDIALPFPRIEIATQLHDHWLAMCAAATGGYAILDQVVQDYVQHEGNVIGEADIGTTRQRPFHRIRTVRALAAQYEAGSGFCDCVRVSRKLSYGWREAMVKSLLERVPTPPAWLTDYGRRLGERTRLGAIRTIAYGLRSPDVANSTTATFVAGLPGELFYR